MRRRLCRCLCHKLPISAPHPPPTQAPDRSPPCPAVACAFPAFSCPAPPPPGSRRTSHAALCASPGSLSRLDRRCQPTISHLAPIAAIVVGATVGRSLKNQLNVAHRQLKQLYFISITAADWISASAAHTGTLLAGPPLCSAVSFTTHCGTVAQTFRSHICRGFHGHAGDAAWRRNV